MIQIGTKEYNEAELTVLAKAGMLNIGQKNDPASTTLTSPALHGPLQGSTTQYGAFTSPGVRPQMWSAMSRPRSWLSVVPVEESDVHNEIVEIFTGMTAATGTNATGWCGNPPTVGALKTCQQAYTFGDYMIKTDLVAAPLVGLRKNRADIARQILNAPASENPFMPESVYQLTDTRSELAHQLYRVGVDSERNTELVSIRGIAATQNNTYLGWWTQFAGLDRQVKTGYTDNVTGLACSAADSIVQSFNANITGTAVGASVSGLTFVEVWFDLAYALKSRARQVGLAVDWAIVMREEQFHRAVEVLANQYNFYRAAGAQYNERNLDVTDVQNLRRAMGAGQYLLDDMGMAWPVLFSEGIPLDATASNTYNADMFVIPISANGMPGIKMQYFKMDNQYAVEFAQYNQMDDIKYLNNGLYIVGERSTGFCKEYLFGARMRLILELPFLAARIDDIQFSFNAPTRQAIPGGSLYVNGGVSYRL